MRFQIQGNRISVGEELRDYLDLRLRFALSRFQHRIRSVAVGLKDLNGPRGGVDKHCRIRVELIPSGSVTVAETDADLRAAIAHAAERAGRTVRRKLERVHHDKTSGPGMSPRDSELP